MDFGRTKRFIKKTLPKHWVEVISVAGGYRAAAPSAPKACRFAGDDPSVLQCCIAYNQYGGYCLPLASIHRPAPTMILSGLVHEPDTIRCIIARLLVRAMSSTRVPTSVTFYPHCHALSCRCQALGI